MVTRYLLFLIKAFLCSSMLLALHCTKDKTTSVKPVPAAPSNLGGQALSSSSIILFWADNSDNETSFIIYRTASDAWWQAAAAPANCVSYTDSLLLDTTAYSYYVLARNSAGTSPPSETLTVMTWSIGTPPSLPDNPLPDDRSSHIALNSILRWNCSDPDQDTLRYDIYFGTSANPPWVDSSMAVNFYNPGMLQYSTTYHWRIVARDNHHHRTIGPEWRFTTIANDPPSGPFNPNPPDSMIGVNTDIPISWQAQDPEGDPLFYDVYFGLGPDPGLVSSNQPGESYDPGALEYLVTYFWRIVVRDSYQHEVSGPVWSFTTENPTSYILTVYVDPYGSGTVEVNPNQQTYQSGDTVALQAVPAQNYTFDHWSTQGRDVYQNPVQITFEQADIIVTAYFSPVPHATINGNVNWPGHALSSRTLAFADTIDQMGFPHRIHQVSVDSANGSFSITIPLIAPRTFYFEAWDDVDNDSLKDAGDGYGFYDLNQNGIWDADDDLIVQPGQTYNGVNITLETLARGAARSARLDR